MHRDAQENTTETTVSHLYNVCKGTVSLLVVTEH